MAGNCPNSLGTSNSSTSLWMFCPPKLWTSLAWLLLSVDSKPNLTFMVLPTLLLLHTLPHHPTLFIFVNIAGFALLWSGTSNKLSQSKFIPILSLIDFPTFTKETPYVSPTVKFQISWMLLHISILQPRLVPEFMSTPTFPLIFLMPAVSSLFPSFGITRPSLLLFLLSFSLPTHSLLFLKCSLMFLLFHCTIFLSFQTLYI